MNLSSRLLLTSPDDRQLHRRCRTARASSSPDRKADRNRRRPSVTSQHSSLSRERWLEFDFHRRILMIANELHRASKWTGPTDCERRRASMERALALVDLTISVEQRVTCLKELLLFRGCLAASYARSPEAPSDRLLLRTLLRFHPEAAKQIPYVAA